VYLRQAKWSEAVPQFQRAIALGSDEEAYENLGTAYFFLKRYDESVKLYEKALQFTSGNQEIWGNLGDAYRWLGQLEKAVLHNNL
jgi:tetratricopeptide (TPR) repeat protein